MQTEPTIEYQGASVFSSLFSPTWPSPWPGHPRPSFPPVDGITNLDRDGTPPTADRSLHVCKFRRRTCEPASPVDRCRPQFHPACSLAHTHQESLLSSQRTKLIYPEQNNYYVQQPPSHPTTYHRIQITTGVIPTRVWDRSTTPSWRRSTHTRHDGLVCRHLHV